MGVIKLLGLTLVLFAGSLFLGGCATSTLFLKKDQYLYTSAKIKGNKKTSAEALEGLQQQQPNRTILGATPYLYFYQLGERLYKKDKVKARIEKTKDKYEKKIAKVKDPKSAKAIRVRNARDQKLDKLNTTLEEGNWLMRTVGEPPSIFDPNLMAQSAREMRNYLFNKGFFDGTVSAKIDTMSKRRIRVVYTVNEGQPQRIRRVRYFAYNQDIQKILDSIAKATKGSNIKEGKDNYDQDKLVAERDRLDKAIRNSGYYAFSRDYIFVEADTSIIDTGTTTKLGNKAIDVLFKVKDPLDREHIKYNMSQVDFHISAQGGFYDTDTNLIKFNGIQYFVPYKDLFTKVLDTKILIRPGQFYNLEVINNTQAQLQSMDYFKFVNFNYDSIGPGDFRLRIQTTRLPKYQLSDEIGLLNSSGAVGPFLNAGIKIRNGLNRFDVLELTGRYSNEGQIIKSRYYSSREIGVNTTLTYPAIVFPFYTSYLFNNRNPKTRLLLGYTDIRRPEYSRAIFKATAGYTISLSPREVLGINLIDAAFNGTRRLDATYRATLEALNKEYGSPIIFSFRSSVVTSLSAFYVFNTSSQLEKKKSTYFRAFAEWGGEVPRLVAGNATNSDGLPLINIDRIPLTVYKFAKVQADFRYYYPVTKISLLAFRLNSGVVVPRNSKNALPYEKYFFSGGPSSNRAWPPRRLAAGFTLVGSGTGLGQEQPGEVLIETTLELRQKLIGFVEGALFIDAGNVWSLPGENSRPQSVFRFNTFLQNMAIGTGAGVRFDFTFLVVRLDAGIKTYDPSLPSRERWSIGRSAFFNNKDDYQNIVLNIGIGYPF